MRTITLNNSLNPRYLLAPDGGIQLKDDKTGETLGTLTEDKGDEGGDEDAGKGEGDKDIFDIGSMTQEGGSNDRSETRIETTEKTIDENGIQIEKKKEVKEDGDEIEVKDDDKKDETKVDDKTATDKSKEVQRRDYTGLDPKDVDYLKKLPNAVYNHVRPLVGKLNDERVARTTAEKELGELKKNPNRIPDSWYEHPEAYTLTPEFQNISGLYSRAEQEEMHWEQQLAAIKGGAKTWKALMYDGKTGTYNLTAEMPVEPMTEIQLSKALNQCATLKNQFQQQAGTLQGTFKQQIESRKTHYNFSEQHFNGLADELKPTKEEQDKFMAVVHPADKNLPLASVAAKMFSVIIRQGTYIQKLRAESATKAKNNNDQRRAGPDNKHGKGGAGPAKGAEDEVDIDDIINEVQGNNE